jgi:hypothetical protein
MAIIDLEASWIKSLILPLTCGAIVLNPGSGVHDLLHCLLVFEFVMRARSTCWSLFRELWMLPNLSVGSRTLILRIIGIVIILLYIIKILLLTRVNRACRFYPILLMIEVQLVLRRMHVSQALSRGNPYIGTAFRVYGQVWIEIGRLVMFLVVKKFPRMMHHVTLCVNHGRIVNVILQVTWISSLHTVSLNLT